MMYDDSWLIIRDSNLYIIVGMEPHAQEKEMGNENQGYSISSRTKRNGGYGGMI